ncbi:hypothetical protein BY458DRAFT_57076 [Sporodiniella umbellata]|nr:hypothetical protein BY458DRAFT_57076 [Sporodiniella umbellata]
MFPKKKAQTIASSLSIELLPGFGWMVGNATVFGPGNLFQGHVVLKCNEHSSKATTLRLVFQATEAMLSHELSPGIQRGRTSNLFGVVTYLWAKREHGELRANGEYRFMFTVQLPMVQFPPSMDHPYYRCSYKLTAYLDPSLAYREIPVMSQRTIEFVPWIEIQALKRPLAVPAIRHHRMARTPKWTASVQLSAVEYRAGETIEGQVKIDGRPEDLGEFSIHLRLYQISQFVPDSKPILRQCVAQKTYTVDTAHLYPVQLVLDDSLPSSMQYSKIMSLSYQLELSIHLHPSSFQRRLFPWTPRVYRFQQAITIGTMERGLCAAQELDVYSNYHKTNMPYPKFLKALDHEDALPLYEPHRLPLYAPLP